MEGPESSRLPKISLNSDIRTHQSEVLPNRNVQLSIEAVITNLENFLGLDFLKRISTENNNMILVNRIRIKDIAKYFRDLKFNLSSIFASDIGDSLEVNYLFHNRPFVHKSSIIIQLIIKKKLELDSIALIYKNAQIHETTLTHRMGIEFIDIAYKAISNEDLYCTPTNFDFKPQTQFQDKTGIYDEIHKSANYFDLNIQENIVQKVEIRDGWNYKKFQPRLENADPINGFAPVLSELSKNHAFHNYLLYTQLSEFINEKSVPLKAKFIRTLGAELERIFSHLLWFTNLADLLGMKRAAKKIYRNYLKLTIHLENHMDPKNLLNIISYGSATDISMTAAQNLYHYFRDSENQIFDDIYNFTYSQKVSQNLAHIGKISQENAIKSGLTGPSIRGSGIPVDIRLNDPYLTYTLGEISQVWNVITFKEGDSFARTQVRLWEIKESIAICKHILHGLSSYGRNLKSEIMENGIQWEPNQHFIDVVEAPQGSLGLYLRSGLKKPLETWNTVRLITPDRANYGVSTDLLKGEELHDLPMILHTLDLNFSMIDL
ncbi:NADH-quinone oxidoreductase subunit C [Candidatus Lokiarchaeum ossiferum]|uniref:NADH-quinone oxidoreductase subunit D-related protein n=1 Tax=Candidatus Lokiarchaeum ossiferum TaxID=2951803 RepID=UPI00352E1443